MRVTNGIVITNYDTFLSQDLSPAAPLLNSTLAQPFIVVSDKLSVSAASGDNVLEQVTDLTSPCEEDPAQVSETDLLEVPSMPTPSPIATQSSPSSISSQSSAQGSSHLSASALRRKRAKAYDTALQFAMHMTTQPPQPPPTPTYIKSVANVLEGIINQVPSHLQSEFCNVLLQQAHQSLAQYKAEHNF